MDYRARPQLERVRCGNCGANTEIIDASTPRCVYCSMPVEVPAAVRRRAADFERALARSRERILQTVESLQPWKEGWREFAVTGYAVLSGVFSAAMWWNGAGRVNGIELHDIRVVFSGILALGPLLLVIMARDYKLERQLAATASLAFARLEATSDELGEQLRLRCPGCGTTIDRARMVGLTIQCTHCRAPLLAPSALVQENQRRYYKRIVRLKKEFEEKRIDTLETASKRTIAWTIGMAVFAQIGLIGMFSGSELNGYRYLAEGVSVLFFMVFGLTASFRMILNFRELFLPIAVIYSPFAFGVVALGAVYFTQRLDVLLP